MCGCIISKNVNNAIKIANQLDCGGAIINGASFFRSFEMPFGGWKHSGIGNEGVMTTLKEMSRTKTIIYYFKECFEVEYMKNSVNEFFIFFEKWCF